LENPRQFPLVLLEEVLPLEGCEEGKGLEVDFIMNRGKLSRGFTAYDGNLDIYVGRTAFKD
jgi:hypothetical protein